MSRRRTLRLLAAFLLVAGSALIALGAPAGAGDLADSGWWYVRPGATGQPPHVPEGGLYVAGAPDGAIALAAVRFTLAEGETEPKLTLEVAAPGAPEDEEEGAEEPPPAPLPVPAAPPAAPAAPPEAQPVILACQAGAGWSGVEAGSADAAPPPACGAGSVPGVPAADGLSWTWDLSKLQIKTTVDVILVAGKVKELPDGANGSTFQLGFAKPTAESLDTISGSAPEPFTPPGGGASFGGAPDLAEGGAADGFATGSGSLDSGGEVTFDAGDDTTSEGPALPEEQQGLTPTAPLVQAQQPGPEVAAAEAAGSTRDTRWLGIVVVLLAGLVAVMANNQPVPPLRGLGPFRREVPVGPDGEVVAATAAGGGLGRFARSRSGAAPRL